MLLVRRFAVILPLAIGKCGGAGSPSVTIESATFAPVLGVNLAASTKTASGVYYRDVVAGTGPVVSPGQQVSAHYTGWLADGTKFDSNGVNDAPIGFRVGARQVIDGWDQGVPGMHVGGTRQLIIPPALGYGSKGYGPIPANAILVFTIDVVSAQ